MLFLSIDPGSVQLGMAVYRDDRLLYYAGYDFKKDPYQRRSGLLWDALEEMYRRYAFTEVAIEAASRFKAKSGALTKIPELEVACTLIKKWAKSRRLGWYSHNAASWRKGFAGTPHADKTSVARVVYLHYPQLPSKLPDHVTDAIGIGSYHYGVRRVQIMAEEVTEDG